MTATLKTITANGIHMRYAEAGSGPLVLFCHGWPESWYSWRHQLAAVSDAGFRAVAPDMRGYGKSTVHPATVDYAVEHIVADMLDLLGSLGRDAAFWVGHDWGASIVWGLAQHHSERVIGVASLCVPYHPEGFAIGNLLPLIDRSVYPVDEYPVGQWDYHLYYEESFDAARAAFDADARATVKALFRKGTPAGRGKPARSAMVRRNGGWFGPAGRRRASSPASASPTPTPRSANASPWPRPPPATRRPSPC